MEDCAVRPEETDSENTAETLGAEHLWRRTDFSCLARGTRTAR